MDLKLKLYFEKCKQYHGPEPSYLEMIPVSRLLGNITKYKSMFIKKSDFSKFFNCRVANKGIIIHKQ